MRDARSAIAACMFMGFMGMEAMGLRDDTTSNTELKYRGKRYHRVGEADGAKSRAKGQGQGEEGAP